MATEPDIVEVLRDTGADRAGGGPSEDSYDPHLLLVTFEAADTIEALRSRVAAQDAELTRLRGLVGRLAGYAVKDHDAIRRRCLCADGGTCPTAALLAEARAAVPQVPR